MGENKGYKFFEDFRLFHDGHVENLLFNPLQDNDKVCLFKAQVKPTQRDKTYLNKDYYSLWFSLDKEDGDVIIGHCECLGGEMSSQGTASVWEGMYMYLEFS